MEQAVLDAAERLIRAYEANDRAGYFAWFTPEASFIFEAAKLRMDSRAEYEAQWDRWVEEDGFAVLECSSFNRRARVYGDMGVFTHQTFTRLLNRGEVVELDELETIIFHRIGQDWYAVHEHVSFLPG